VSIKAIPFTAISESDNRCHFDLNVGLKVQRSATFCDVFMFGCNIHSLINNSFIDHAVSLFRLDSSIYSMTT